MLRIFSLPLALLAAPQVLGAQTLHDFESAPDVAAWKGNDARVEVTTEGTTSKARALKITFAAGIEWPHARVNSPKPLDWSKAGALAMDVVNQSATRLWLGVRVDDSEQADGVLHCRTGNTSLAPGEKTTLVMPLAKASPMDLGMRGLPPTEISRRGRDIGAGGSGPFDTSHIMGYQLFSHKPTQEQVLVVDNIRLIAGGAPNLDKISDRFGQFSQADWPGKIKDEAELLKRKSQEDQVLGARPALPNRNRFGGWSAGPQLKASGFFRGEQRDGKWWLVDPDGRLFFSAGVDTMNGNNGTITTGRAKMFAWLPEKDSEWKEHWAHESNVHSGPVKEGDSFSFYSANLRRKDGAAWKAAWLDRSTRRLSSWGFNTIGNWSDQALFNQKVRVPYTVTLGVWGGDHARLSSGDDYWGAHHDAFDPKFEAVVRRLFAQNISDAMRNDPFNLGYFVDNELAWGSGTTPKSRYGLAYGALALEAGKSPAKTFFIHQLRAKYNTIEGLNAAWKSDLASWQVLEASYQATVTPNEAMASDLSMFVLEHARKYFSVINAALKARDPNHLYLGCRFAWRTDEAVKAAAEVCDVVSFNIYKRAVDAEWDFAKSLGKPCLIGEFHFGALDRGMFHTGLVPTNSQVERAALYETYMTSVLDHPAFVGAHWFQYIDEPLTGRSYDGENYNIGLVDATDTPYPELNQAAIRVHTGMYERRARK